MRYLLCLAVLSLTCLQASAAEGSQRFEFIRIGEVPQESIASVSRALEANYDRILSDLGVGSLPATTVKIWSDRAAFKQEFENGGGRGGVADGYVNTESMELRLLDGPEVASVAIHEFAHRVTLAVNPTIAANPFWLWESVALFEDGSGPPDTRELSCISAEGGPSLAELNQYPGSTKVFRMGYLLAEFIIERWGRGVLISLIRNNGRIEETLGITEKTFEESWLEHVLARYEFSSPGPAMIQEELIADFSGNTLSNKAINQSVFMAQDGTLSYGSHGAVQFTGRWSATEENEICLELGGVTRCSRWYRSNQETYLLASNSDCVFQEWILVPGEHLNGPERR